MTKIILLFFITFSISAELISGRGRFYGRNGDSVAFIKEQLLYSSYQNVISKEFNKMGLNSNAFWSSYKDKFEDYFLKIKEEHDAQYNLEKNPKIIKTEKYKKIIRMKRLNSMRKFGYLSSVVKSYSIRKISKSLKLPNSHYMNISATIDRKKLTYIYYKFIGKGENRKLKKLYIDVSYYLKEIGWSELGVEVKKDFIDIIKNFWKKKFEEHFSILFSEGIEFIDEDQRKDINLQLKTLNEFKNNEIMSKIQNSFFLKIEVEISKRKISKTVKKMYLNFSGGFILTDLQNGRVLSFADFAKEKLSFDTNDQEAYTSNIASLVYRLPIGQIQVLRKKIEDNLKKIDSIELLIKGKINIDQLSVFIQHLREKGVLYYFTPEVTSLFQEEIKLNILFSGNRKKVISFIDSIKLFKIDKDSYLEKDYNVPFVFNFIQEKKLEMLGVKEKK